MVEVSGNCTSIVTRVSLTLPPPLSVGTELTNPLLTQPPTPTPRPSSSRAMPAQLGGAGPGRGGAGRGGAGPLCFAVQCVELTVGGYGSVGQTICSPRKFQVQLEQV